jgi:hypothetical protein
MFKFFKNGKEITPPQRIKWYFEGREGIFFESKPEKLEINSRFWRNKLGIAEDTKVILLPEDGIDIEGTKLENNEPSTAQPIADHASDIADDNGVAEQPSVPETTQDSVDTPKRKRRKKADELSDLPTELDNADSSATE